MFHASTMRVKDTKKAAKLQGAKLQGAIAQLPQAAAEDATLRQGGVDTCSQLTSSAVLAPKEAMTQEGEPRLDTASRTFSARPGFPCDDEGGTGMPTTVPIMPLRCCRPLPAQFSRLEVPCEAEKAQV